jgi:TPR repeat protein
MFENGRGVLQDCRKAARLYNLAASLGMAEAQNNLAWCRERGKGVRKDKVVAVRLYRLAAAQGNEHAAESLERLGAA